LIRPMSSSVEATKRMLAVRRRGTDCELKLAFELARLNIVFEQHVPVLTDWKLEPDFVFRAAKLAIFVDGCFWHGCPAHGSIPRANREWWKEKIAANKQRDRRNVRRLKANGWMARRFWAHESSHKIVSTVLTLLQQRAGAD
jgi:DNA mismatch endonuclease, patch repair protein